MLTRSAILLKRSHLNSRNEALTSARPVIWIPKDDLSVADNEIIYIRKTYDNIWISNEGASLDAQGKLRVWGDPPANLEKNYRFQY